MAGELETIETALLTDEENDLLRGEIDLGSGGICACIGPFEVQQVLKDGGFSPMLLSTVTVRKCLLPKGAAIKSGIKLDVRQFGTERHCKIQSCKDLLIAWEITVNDLNQNA